MILQTAPDIDFVGESGTFAGGLEQVGALCPDIAVVDIHLPDGSGFELTRRIKASHPSCKVIVLSAQNENLCARYAIECGADGFVGKDAEPDEIRDAVLTAWRGDLALSQSARDWVLRSLRSEHQGGIQRLTSREFEVFLQLGMGRNTKEIATILGVSPRTVETYHGKVREKLCVPHHDALIRLSTMVFSSSPSHLRNVQSDIALVRAFENRTVTLDQWGPSTFARIAYCYLARGPFSSALKSLTSGMHALRETLPTAAPYNLTVVAACARVIRSKVDADPAWMHSFSFLAAHPELEQTPPELLVEHYTPQLLTEARAHERFIEPDLEPLPMVPKQPRGRPLH